MLSLIASGLLWIPFKFHAIIISGHLIAGNPISFFLANI